MCVLACVPSLRRGDELPNLLGTQHSEDQKVWPHIRVDLLYEAP
jgi:hypothetical protein